MIWVLIVVMSVVGLAWVKVRRRRKAGTAGRGPLVMAPRVVKRLRDAKGTSLIEAAIITPLFLLLTFSIVDFGALFYAYLALENGVSLASRYGVTGRAMDDPLNPGTPLDHRGHAQGGDAARERRR